MVYEVLAAVYFVRLPTPRDTPSAAHAVHYGGITYRLITRRTLTRHLYNTVVTRGGTRKNKTAII